MLSRLQLKQCIQVINNNGVIAYPTESVFGLGCNPLSEEAVSKILHLKHRPAEKGLILIAETLTQLEPFTQLNDQWRKQILETKAPTTWLVRKSKMTPDWICGRHSKVAIRVSQHPVVKAICNNYRGPIVSTSANPAGSSPANTLLQARLYFNGQVDMFVPGSTGDVKQATPIIDIESQRQIRA